jgi:hypothetical protein
MSLAQGRRHPVMFCSASDFKGKTRRDGMHACPNRSERATIVDCALWMEFVSPYPSEDSEGSRSRCPSHRNNRQEATDPTGIACHRMQGTQSPNKRVRHANTERRRAPARHCRGARCNRPEKDQLPVRLAARRFSVRHGRHALQGCEPPFAFLRFFPAGGCAARRAGDGCIGSAWMRSVIWGKSKHAKLQASKWRRSQPGTPELSPLRNLEAAAGASCLPVPATIGLAPQRRSPGKSGVWAV